MKHRIVVLGAGYTGTGAAGLLARRLPLDQVEIVLVNAAPDFVERVRLHQIATGQQLQSRSLTEIFAGTGVRVEIARVGAVDVDRRTVELTDGATLTYDTLIYALGSTAADAGIPGVAEYAHNLSGPAGALALRDRLRELPAGATVLVVGGGLTGIEAATEIAESRPDLRVRMAARGGVGDWLSERAQRYLDTVFARLGITVHAGTEITEVTAGGVRTASGTGAIPADVTVWCAGFAVHPIAAATTLTLADTGRIVVDRTMRSVSHPQVYAIGDAASAEGAGGIPLRMSCAAGHPMAWRAARAVTARLTGAAVPEGLIGFYSQCISLGRRDGLVQRVHFDDQMADQVLTGRLAARVKELICTGAAWAAAHPGVFNPGRRRGLAGSDAVTGIPANRGITAQHT